MRKTLTIIATFLVLAGLFAGSWFVTGLLRSGDDSAATVGTTSQSTAEDATSAAQTGSSEPGSSQPSDGLLNTADLAFPLPKNLIELNTSLRTAMFKFGANEFAVNRIGIYATIAYFDTLNPPGSPTFIATEAAGQGEEQAILAGGALVSELLANPVMTDLIEAWGVELSPQTASVVSSIVAFAEGDGYAGTADAKAPSYDGDLAWKPGGLRDGNVDGYEPGYGQLRAILVDPALCPVSDAPLERIRSERSSLADVDKSSPQPALPRTDKFALLVSIYLAQEADFDRAYGPQASQVAAVMLHDALIATWKAKWANGVAAPIDVTNPDDPTLLTSYPSYPSWTDVAVAAAERYVSEITGRTTTLEDMLGTVEKVTGAELVEALQIADDIARARSSTFHWKADREAGRDLGTCIAVEALKTFRK
jgi:hypothetical protein